MDIPFIWKNYPEIQIIWICQAISFVNFLPFLQWRGDLRPSFEQNWTVYELLTIINSYVFVPRLLCQALWSPWLRSWDPCQVELKIRRKKCPYVPPKVWINLRFLFQLYVSHTIPVDRPPCVLLLSIVFQFLVIARCLWRTGDLLCLKYTGR